MFWATDSKRPIPQPAARHLALPGGCSYFCRMPFTLTMRGKRVFLRTTLRWSVLGLLMALYTLGSLRVESVHRLIHDHDAELHTEAQERNACHRTIFHGSSSSCEHPVHVSANWTCTLSDLAFDTHAPEFRNIRLKPNIQDISLEEGQEAKPLIGQSHRTPARAPPFG